MMKTFLISILTILILGCNINLHRNNLEKPDKIIICKLPHFYNTPIRIKCGEINKNRKDVIVKIINRRKDINEFYSLFEDTNNFTKSNYDHLDSRMQIEYYKKGLCIKTFCSSHGLYIERADGVYLGNKKIEDYLLKQKLIFKILPDSISH